MVSVNMPNLNPANDFLPIIFSLSDRIDPWSKEVFFLKFMRFHYTTRLSLTQEPLNQGIMKFTIWVKAFLFIRFLSNTPEKRADSLIETLHFPFMVTYSHSVGREHIFSRVLWPFS